MKKALTLLLFLISATIYSQKDTTSCLKLFGTALDKGEILTGVEVRLYDGKLFTGAARLNGRETPLFLLEKNKKYYLEISRKGYETRWITINTSLPEEINTDPLFRFFFELEMLKKGSDLDQYYLDFPIAIISYNQETDKFEHAKRYTDNIRKSIGLEFTSNSKR